jgi:hypothetical protein
MARAILGYTFARPEGKRSKEMRRKTRKQQPKPADALLKTSRKKDIELTEKELGKVSGGVGFGDIKGERIEDQHKGDIEIFR